MIFITIDNKEITLVLMFTLQTGRHRQFVTEQAGSKVPLPHDPLGLFSLFFDECLMSKIVEETNRYAEQCLRGTNKQWSTDGAL